MVSLTPSFHCLSLLPSSLEGFPKNPFPSACRSWILHKKVAHKLWYQIYNSDKQLLKPACESHTYTHTPVVDCLHVFFPFFFAPSIHAVFKHCPSFKMDQINPSNDLEKAPSCAICKWNWPVSRFVFFSYTGFPPTLDVNISAQTALGLGQHG